MLYSLGKTSVWGMSTELERGMFQRFFGKNCNNYAVRNGGLSGKTGLEVKALWGSVVVVVGLEAAPLLVLQA